MKKMQFDFNPDGLTHLSIIIDRKNIKKASKVQLTASQKQNAYDMIDRALNALREIQIQYYS